MILCVGYPFLYIRHTSISHKWFVYLQRKQKVQWNFPGKFLSVCIRIFRLPECYLAKTHFEPFKVVCETVKLILCTAHSKCELIQGWLAVLVTCFNISQLVRAVWVFNVASGTCWILGEKSGPEFTVRTPNSVSTELVGSTWVEKYWPGFSACLHWTFKLDNLNSAWCMYLPSFQFS